MRDRFIKTLCELAENDRRIMLITGDLGFAVLDEYRQRFPRQFINAGVAEQNMTLVATGLAIEGHIVDRAHGRALGKDVAIYLASLGATVIVNASPAGADPAGLPDLAASTDVVVINESEAPGWRWPFRSPPPVSTRTARLRCCR